MRRGWSWLGAALVTAIMLVAVISTVGLAYGSHAGAARGTTTNAGVAHGTPSAEAQRANAPSNVRPFAVVVTPSIVGTTPLPGLAPIPGPITISFAVAITGANGVPLSAANTTVWVTAAVVPTAPTKQIANYTIPGAGLTFIPPSPLKSFWEIDGAVVVNYAVMNSTGNSKLQAPASNFTGKSYGFQIWATAAGATGHSPTPAAPGWRLGKPSHVITTFTMPASTTVPMHVFFNLTTTNVTVSSSTVSAKLDAWNTAANATSPIASANVSSQIAAGSISQVLTVDYAYLLSLNYKGGVLPAGTYFFNLTVSVSNYWEDTKFGPGDVPTFKKSNPGTLTLVNLKVLQSALPTFTTVPFWVNWTVNLTGASIGPSNTAQLLQVTDVTNSTGGGFVLNQSIPAVSGQSAYTFSMTVTALTSGNWSGSLGNVKKFPADTYAITIFVTASGSGVGNRTASSVQHTNPAVRAPVGTIKAGQVPFGSVPAGIGNVTISGNYSGDYLTSANVTVSSAAGVAFAQGVFTPGKGLRSYSVSWTPTAAGTYTVTLAVGSLTKQSFTAATTVLVNVTGGGTITKWTNTTLLGGLSPGLAAALLMVIGLVIGLIVALALGRMMWGTPKQPPAQPWQQTTTTTAFNCPVCNQSFATEDELKEHQKSAHGMGS